jgi:hypothetical protein
MNTKLRKIRIVKRDDVAEHIEKQNRGYVKPARAGVGDEQMRRFFFGQATAAQFQGRHEMQKHREWVAAFRSVEL